MASEQYEELKVRLGVLVEEFVDFRIPLDRDPTPLEKDKIAAFKLLAHAEFETFLEGRIQFAISRSVEIWDNRKAVTRCLFNLVIRWYPWFEKDKNPNILPRSIGQARLLIECCVRKAHEEITSNHGIKQEAFKRLAYSGGLLTDELEGTLLAALESYGKTRGDVAHVAVGRVRTMNDPGVEAEDANTLLQLLEQFDGNIILIVSI